MTEKIKVLFLGESGVGKSSLINRYFNDKFNENIMSTSSTFSTTKKLKIMEMNIILIYLIHQGGKI